MHNLPCLGSASSCRRRRSVGSSLYSRSEACASCSLRAVIASTRPSTLPVRPPKACSLVSYPCAITGMHACSCDNAHACTRSDGPAYSPRPGANPPWLSGLCLAATPVGGPLSTQRSERFFELLTPFCRRVNTLVGRLSLSATQCLRRSQSTWHDKRYACGYARVTASYHAGGHSLSGASVPQG